MKILSFVLAVASLSIAAFAQTGTLVEKFNTDPSLDGWQASGDTNLFGWDSTNQMLDVMWDSTQPNSYYYHPLGRTVTTNDGFCIVFDLQLNDAVAIQGGSELAIGLLNFADATNAGFSRANGTSTNVFEFDYFPQFFDDNVTYPASIEATLIDATNNYYFTYDDLPLNPGVTYHVLLLHYPNTIGISGEVFTNGQLMTSLPIVDNYEPTNDDGAFQLDTLAVMNYADGGYGDILAHGAVKNLAFASPLPVGLVNTVQSGQIQFASDTNWVYTLEQSADFQNWSAAAPPLAGNGTTLVMQATNLTAGESFYQVRADLR
jgi:hypothetical protein